MTRSVWLTRHHGDAPGFPPLRDDIVAEVVIIGAGIVGATLAHDLAVRGVDVVLLEADRVGAGTTGHTSAKATALQSLRYASMASRHGDAAAAAYGVATMAAVERIAEEEESFDRRAAVTWSHDDTDRSDLEDEADAMRRAGVPVELRRGPVGRLPSRHALVLEGQGAFDPVARVHRLVRVAREAGARVHEHSRVASVTARDERREVEVHGGGRVDAGRVVVATGLPVLDRGLWFARAEPQQSHVVVLRCGQPPEEMSLRVSGGTRSARALTVDGNPAVLVTGEGNRTGLGGDTRRRADVLAAWARERFAATDEITRWSAQDYSSADGLPLVGPLVPGDDRVLAACGFDKWGLTSGTTAAGTLLRRLIGDAATDIDRLTDPARLPDVRGGVELARNAGVTGLELGRGWLRWLPPDPDGDPQEGEGRVHREGHRLVASSRTDGVERRVSAVCTHLGGSVRWDAIEQGWACPLHGSRFGPDGAVRCAPATDRLASLVPSEVTAGAHADPEERS